MVLRARDQSRGAEGRVAGSKKGTRERGRLGAEEKEEEEPEVSVEASLAGASTEPAAAKASPDAPGDDGESSSSSMSQGADQESSFCPSSFASADAKRVSAEGSEQRRGAESC